MAAHDYELDIPELPGPTPPSSHSGLNRMDWLMAVLFGLAVTVACLFIARALPSFLFQSMDFWFEADTLREISNMTRVHDDHYRTSVNGVMSDSV